MVLVCWACPLYREGGGGCKILWAVLWSLSGEVCPLNMEAGRVASFHVQHYVWLHGCREVGSFMHNVTCVTLKLERRGKVNLSVKTLVVPFEALLVKCIKRINTPSGFCTLVQNTVSWCSTHWLVCLKPNVTVPEEPPSCRWVTSTPTLHTKPSTVVWSGMHTPTVNQMFSNR